MSDSIEKRSFLSDPSIPKPLKIAVVVILLFVAIYPFLGGMNSSDDQEAETVTEKKRDVSEMGLPVSEHGQALTSEEKKFEASISHSSAPVEVETETADMSNYEIFTKISVKAPRALGLRRYGTEEIWVSTPQQVVSFGKSYTPFTQLDDGIFDQLFEKDIQAITAFSSSKDSKAAVGTLTGQLLAYDRNDWRLLLQGTEEAKAPITAVGLNGDSLFFSQRGLNKINLKTGVLSKFPSFADIRITDLIESQDGVLYMAARNGIWRLIEQGWEQLLPLKDSDPLPIALEILTDGRIGVGTEDGFILLNKDGTFISKHFGGLVILSVEEISPGKILLGTLNKGLRYFDGDNWYEGASLSRLPSSSIRKIETDNQDNVWIAFDNAGLFRAKIKDLTEWITEKKDSSKVIDPTQPRDYGTACRAADEEMKEIRSSGTIRAITLEQRTHVFVNGLLACPSGIGFINEGGQGVIVRGFGGTVFDATNPHAAKTTKFALPETHQKNPVRSAFIDSKRNLWLGTDNGVMVLLSDRIESFENEEELKGSSARAVTEDDLGNIWVGTVPPYDREKKIYTKAPLHRYDWSGWKKYSVGEGMPSWTVTALRFAPGFGLFIGSEAGAYKYANEKFEKINFGSQEINLRSVASISQLIGGRIWFGYLYSTKGLTLWENGSGRSIDPNSAIAAQYFQNAGEDKDGQLWGVTPNGTTWIFPSSLSKNSPSPTNK
jgi:ligand-binding sensor domain-containing protein